MRKDRFAGLRVHYLAFVDEVESGLVNNSEFTIRQTWERLADKDVVDRRGKLRLGLGNDIRGTRFVISKRRTPASGWGCLIEPHSAQDKMRVTGNLIFIAHVLKFQEHMIAMRFSNLEGF